MVSIRYTIRIAHKEWKKDRNLFDIARECGTHTHTMDRQTTTRALCRISIPHLRSNIRLHFVIGRTYIQ